MLSAIRHWFRAPEFPEDENKTRIAVTLNAVLLMGLGGAVVYILFILVIAQVEFKSLLFSLIPISFLLGLRYLLKRGQVYVASTLLVVLSWLNLTLAAIVDGYGIRGTSLYGYVIIVIVAGLLIDWRAAVAVALANVASGLFMIYADNHGWLPSKTVTQTDFTIWSASAVFSVSAAFILGIALRSLNSALRRASISESYYRMLFEEAPDGILIVGEDNRIRMANAAIYQMTGYAPAEVIGRSPLDFVAPDDLAIRPPRPLTELKTAGSHKRERVLIHKNGSRLNVIISSTFMPDGQFQYVIQDITEHKRIESALRTSEEKFAKSFQSSPDAITISVVDSGKFIEVNEGFCKMSGYSREEALGRSAEELHIWEDVDRRREMIRVLYAEGRVRDFETTLRRKTGESLTCLLNVEAVELGGQHCMVVITRDVTQRKRMEEELRLSEERYRLVSSVISDYTFSNIQNEKGEIVLTWVAGAFERISGYTFEEFNARGGWVSTVHPDDLAQDERDMEKLRRNEQVISEIRTIHKDGSIRWMKSYAHPVWDEGKKELIGIYGAVQDITDRKQIEYEREQLIKDLEAINQELEQFTYTVSHDLKAPLITIKGFLGFLGEDTRAGNTKRVEADIQRINEAADKMHQLLTDLLELSRIGRLMNPPETVVFQSLVREALELTEGRLQERGIEIIVNEALPNVYGDRQRLLEVLQNLMDNAAKFMGDQSHPIIEIGQDAGNDSGFVTFFIRDNGIGVAPEFHERIFGLFNRLHPKIEGTGIGLTLVRRIVEFHGGRIWIRSDVGEGATFYFMLPMTPPATMK